MTEMQVAVDSLYLELGRNRKISLELRDIEKERIS